jgi:hypothetical protein
MSSARELLEKRKNEVRASINEMIERYQVVVQSMHGITDELSAAAKELKEIDLAIKAVDGEQAKSGRIKIMDAVLETLRRNPLGMTAKEILEELNAKYYAGKLQRHSLSPQLSRLKDRDKKIEFRNDRWIRLPDHSSLFKGHV